MSTSFLLALILAAPTAAGDGDSTRNAYVATDDPLGESVTSVVYLDQGWTPAVSQQFYFTSQGAQIVPYDWFLALEQADSTTPFRDHKNILKFRYLPQNAGPHNPDGLPVGFVGDEGSGRKWFGLTCAACHSNEIHYQKVAYRIDGAPTQGDVQALYSALIYAMQRTLNDSDKFQRFASKVLKPQNTLPGQTLLRAQLAAAIDRRVGYSLRNFPGYNPQQIPPAPSMYGRLDALGAISNEVFHRAVMGDATTPPTANARSADAPVSYPCLWDTHQHDYVQWLGAARSGGPLDVFSLARNVGEDLGVGADFVIPEHPSPLGYSSSVKFSGLEDLEGWNKTLWSPQWPEGFPPIDRTAARAGEALYRQNCVECHAIINRTDPDRKIIAQMRAVGTDPKVGTNFLGRTGQAGKLTGANANLVPFTATIPPVAGASMILGNVVIGTILGAAWPAPPDYLSQVTFQPPISGAAVSPTDQGVKYKGRPLNGIWATAPYLHNGSVANLDELLQPAASRSTSFAIGVRTFDPVHVGYVKDAPGFPRFHVVGPDGQTIPGNWNGGHEYGKNLTAEQRKQLLEYLKSL